MPSLSLTDLVDIVSKSGTPKATRVATVKTRPDYMPAFDFYKPLREHIVEIHRQGGDRKALEALLSRLDDQKKLTNYPGAIEGYRKWWGRKRLEWFDPPKGSYVRGGMEVTVNPELGLRIDGTPHLVKLYFKADPLSRLRVELITVLMEATLRPKCEHGELMSVLDVRKSKLFTLSSPVAPAKAVVDAELAYVAALWPNV